MGVRRSFISAIMPNCAWHTDLLGAFGLFQRLQQMRSSEACPHPLVHLLSSLLHCCLFYCSTTLPRQGCWQDPCPGCSQPPRAAPGDGSSHRCQGCSLHASPPGPYLGVNPLGTRGRVLHPAVEVHGQHVLGTGFLPGVAVPEPVVSFFHLPKGARVVKGPPSPGVGADPPPISHCIAKRASATVGCFNPGVEQQSWAGGAGRASSRPPHTIPALSQPNHPHPARSRDTTSSSSPAPRSSSHGGAGPEQGTGTRAEKT